jgi:hypothetical protein
MTTLGFSMELSSGALTRVADMPVIMACRHGGAIVVSDGARLYRVGGDSDDGAPIAIRLALPATDCGDPGPKRLTGVHLEGVLGGRVGVLATSEAGSSLEGVTAGTGGTGDTGLPGRVTARLGRGYGRTWRIALACDDGADFDVGAILLAALPLDRRPA